MSKIVVTGYGLKVAGAGNPTDFKDMLLEGKSGLQLNSDYTPNGESIWLGIVDDSLDELSKKHHKLTRNAQLAVASTIQALSMAKLPHVPSRRVGIFLGNSTSSIVGVTDLYKKFSKGNSLLGLTSLSKVNPHESVSTISELIEGNGIARTLASACTSGLDAIEDALAYMEAGKIDVAIVGASDVPQFDLFVGIFMKDAFKYGSDVNRYGSPFNSRSIGGILAEGSGILILETENHALSRGASVLGSLVALNSSSDSTGIFLPDRSGQSMNVVVARTFASIKPTYFNSQALGDQINDRIEEHWLQDIFSGEVPVTSIRGHIGSPFGAAGLLQVLASLISFEFAFIPKVIRTDGKGYDVNLVKENIFTLVSSVGVTTHGHGGNNSCLVIENYT